jgi:hypothetical protein
MKRARLLIGLSVLAALMIPASEGMSQPTRLKLDPSFGAPPLYFIVNRGQAATDARFYAKTGEYTLWLTRDGLVFDLGTAGRYGSSTRTAASLLFKNASPSVQLSAADPSNYRVSYFYGRDESDWITDIATSRAVLYKDLYDGIDLKVYGTNKEVEYDWVVRPGADASRIRFGYDGTPAASIDRAGDLVVKSASGELRNRLPSAFQVIDGRRVAVVAAYKSKGKDEYGFAVGEYDRRFDLVIDPLVLVYSTYLGGYGDEWPDSVTEDKTGAIYVAGFTVSKDFPPYHVSKPRNDMFVTKLSSDGRTLIYSAFFPSGAVEGSRTGLAVDDKGYVYLSGATSNRSFPVKNAFQKTIKGRADAFFLKLTPNGKGLVFSSYLGGSESDECQRLVLDASGSLFLTGQTLSLDYPILKAYQKTHKGQYDIFVSKFAPDGKTLIYSTYLGGSGYEYGNALAIDGQGAAYIAGATEGEDFPIKNAFQPKKGGGPKDGFIAKLSSAGDELVYSSYLGGSSEDVCYAVAVDSAGAAYLTGLTDGSFPLKNAFQKIRKGSSDAFIAKVAPDDSSLVYSTFLGGSGFDRGGGIAVDGAGKAYIAGYTGSRNFPLKNPYQSVLKGSYDAFLSVFAPNGKSLVASTYLGGSYREWCWETSLGADGTILITGTTNSLDFPTLKPYQKSLKNGDDVFVLKFQLKSD